MLPVRRLFHAFVMLGALLLTPGLTLKNPPQAAGLQPERLGGFVHGFSRNMASPSGIP